MPRQVNILDDAEWPAAGFHFQLPIRPDTTALGVIDVQGYAIDSDGHLAHTVQRHSPDVHKAFAQRAETMMFKLAALSILL